jgi:hypothetical protein
MPSENPFEKYAASHASKKNLKKDFEPFVSSRSSPNSLKWRLLQTYLEKFDDVVYYKAVCKRILTLGFEIPNYIINSFKVVVVFLF